MTLRPAKRWIVASPMPPAAADALGEYHPVLAQALYNRGVTTAAAAREFLAAEYSQTDDPDRMLGVSAAVERLERARRARERVAVYGDYDTDGVTATVLLTQALAVLGLDAVPYIPDRMDEGYGLNIEALDALKAQGVRAVVTVDCGIRSLEEAEHARRIGLDLIISDHHHPLKSAYGVGAELPRALAVINPKQPGCPYPEKHLAGVGLAYKLAQGLFRRLGAPEGVNEESLLDLVALGTVADLAPLSGENRSLVRRGLRALNARRRPGTRALAEVARVKSEGIDAGVVGFVLGPRLNAAGRLDSAMAAYELLNTADRAAASRLAAQLDAQNRERQRLTLETQQHAREIALQGRADPPPLLFAAHPDFPPGIVGLAAARLTDEFYRPAVVAHVGASRTRGSARSIKEFHITEALDRCQHLLERHGGHAAAAGFTTANENAEALAERLRALAAESLAGRDLRPAIVVDAELDARHGASVLAQMNERLIADLRGLEPCGYGNPSPVLAARGLKVASKRTVGSDGAHLKLYLTDGRVYVDAIAFRMGSLAERLPPVVDVAFAAEINEWNGERRVQLNVKDIRWAE